jgi:UDP-2-acetamido-3-amino-2,3-dideoxy-glucuronate N-acetyltransferase
MTIGPGPRVSRADQMLPTQKAGVAVVGCGDWGKNLVRNFSELGSLRAVCDTDPARLEACLGRSGDAVRLTGFDDVLRREDVNAVVIATPSATHYDLAKKAIAAGRDVLVEKPMALDLGEAEELVSSAAAVGRILMVGHVLLFHPAVSRLKSMIDRGELGRINYIYSNRLNLGKFRTEENILWSFAPHDISIILHLLNALPVYVSSSGAGYLNPRVADVTLTNLDFPGGVKSHIFVSWLHPFKEQKLVVVGDKRMALFDDVNMSDKLTIYDHKIDWVAGLPVPRPDQGAAVPLKGDEPLRLECRHFLECVEQRRSPLTSGEHGLRVSVVLEACQKSLTQGGKSIRVERNPRRAYFIHESSVVDEPAEIGEGTKIWHFSHVLKDCRIGRDCTIGQNVSIGPHVTIGRNVKIQNNVSVYEGVTLEDDVFCGPSMVFTNVINPRSHWPRRDEFKPTLIKQGASLGANSTVLCGLTIGRYAFVGAGALVNRDVPDYALVYGAPARIKGWMCYCGGKLPLSASASSRETAVCGACGRAYRKEGLVVSGATE